MNGKKGGNATALLILPTDNVAGAFRCDEDDIHVFRWANRFVMNGKAVAKKKALALAEIWGDVLFVDGGNLQIGYCDKNDIGTPDGFRRGKNFESVFFCNGNRLAALVESDGDTDAAVFEVEGVGVSLRAESDHRDFASAKGGKAGVTVVIDAGRHGFFSC